VSQKCSFPDGLVGVQHSCPALDDDELNWLGLFDGLSSDIEGKGVRGITFALGCGGYTGLQIEWRGRVWATASERAAGEHIGRSFTLI
jgi:hypothetical protein